MLTTNHTQTSRPNRNDHNEWDNRDISSPNKMNTKSTRIQTSPDKTNTKSTRIQNWRREYKNSHSIGRLRHGIPRLWTTFLKKPFATSPALRRIQKWREYKLALTRRIQDWRAYKNSYSIGRLLRYTPSLNDLKKPFATSPALTRRLQNWREYKNSHSIGRVRHGIPRLWTTKKLFAASGVDSASKCLRYQ